MDEKEEWILQYIRSNQFKAVDILEENFVNSYIEKFSAKYIETLYGAPKCKELSKLLSSMYKKGLLNRYPQGIKKLSSDGFPKWVYCYEEI